MINVIQAHNQDLALEVYVNNGQMQNIYIVYHGIVQEKIHKSKQVISIGTLTVVTQTQYTQYKVVIRQSHLSSPNKIYSSGLKHRFQSLDLNRKLVHHINT